MPTSTTEYRPTEITIIIVLIALLPLLPPLLHLWTGSNSAWYTPYLVWFGIIMLSFGLQRYLRRSAR
ncbi:MAG: hypothetical protein IIC58_12995 [Proteobacteria bacterium]|nr:hypothetical protein [Pseudomonadota bacterium]